MPFSGDYQHVAGAFNLNGIDATASGATLHSGALARTITDPDFDVPTTIDRTGARIYAVNARFGTATPDDPSYHVVKAG